MKPFENLPPLSIVRHKERVTNMLKKIDESWNELIKMGRIHRGNRLLHEKNFFKKSETFYDNEPSKYCNNKNDSNFNGKEKEKENE